MRRASLLLLLPLLALSLAPGRRGVAADGAARVRFPADAPPRNDIRVENRVPVRDA